MNGITKSTTTDCKSCSSTRVKPKLRWAPGLLNEAGRVLGLTCFIFMGLGHIGAIQAASDCGLEPCPGTAPAVWSERSATLDGSMRILGWNLLPQMVYEIVVVLPDGTSMSDGFVTTDVEGDFLGDDYDLTPAELALLTEGQPHVCVVDPVRTGVYEVRAYEWMWSGDLAEVPVASTTFLHN